MTTRRIREKEVHDAYQCNVPKNTRYFFNVILLFKKNVQEWSILQWRIFNSYTFESYYIRSNNLFRLRYWNKWTNLIVFIRYLKQRCDLWIIYSNIQKLNRAYSFEYRGRKDNLIYRVFYCTIDGLNVVNRCTQYLVCRRWW
jgi:hypothetical protein